MSMSIAQHVCLSRAARGSVRRARDCAPQCAREGAMSRRWKSSCTRFADGVVVNVTASVKEEWRATGDESVVGVVEFKIKPVETMAIHTFGDYLDFHPHLHALVADGLFAGGGRFHVMPPVSLRPLETLFQARMIAFLVKKGLLPPERARMLRGWKHSGFNVYRSRRVQPDERADLERLARYIIRNPFFVEMMQVNPAADSILYRSGMNEKIHRNVEVFTPCEFIAAITQHIPDKSFQLVR